MTKSKLAYLIAVVSLLAAAALVGCADDERRPEATGGSAGTSSGAAPEACSGNCMCEADQMCNYACTADCGVECLGGRCTAECPDGGCALDADLGAVASYSCEGGGCVVDCDGESECTVDCPAGGCEVACDGDSRCTVFCGDGGDPCVVSCPGGGQATCTGNCDLSCDVCDPTPDPDYMPEIDPANFTNVIDNPLFPLPVGAVWKYEAATEGELITVTVTSETVTVMGVDCVVVHDEARTPSGDLIEDTRDWYAQDNEGNVWYFGEDTAEYVNGQVANRNGAWEAGVDGALPGIIMQAAPEKGMTYYQEYLVCQAEDQGEVMALGESVSGPTGDYSDCVRIRDFSLLDPLADEFKTFCPGVGLVLTTDPETGDTLEELTSVELP